jgi:hypothetical protein
VRAVHVRGVHARAMSHDPLPRTRSFGNTSPIARRYATQ